MLNKLVDLHCHSIFSDGTLSPEELVILAKKQGLSALALTDHDTLDGLAEFHINGLKYGLETISGIEFGVLCPTPPYTEIHILGLCIDENSKAIKEKISFIQNARVERNYKMIQRLCDIGIPITIAELEKNAGGEIITRAHFANVMLEKGLIATRDEAFSKYISPGLSGYVERDFLSCEDCIKCIIDAKGVAVLAHPTLYHMDKYQIKQLCQTLKQYGLIGIEVRHAAFTKSEEKQLDKISTSLNLLPSGGSDFHGANKPDINLGVGRGNLKIPYSYLKDLQCL